MRQRNDIAKAVMHDKRPCQTDPRAALARAIGSDDFNVIDHIRRALRYTA